MAAAHAGGAGEAERWEAFRRYLTDFPRLQEAPPATLALWERYLVYGIAFGIAERVLQAAHLAMPEELAQASTIYWISPERRPRLGRRPRSAIDLAVDMKAGGRVALKLLTPELSADERFRQRFMREAEFAASASSILTSSRS